MNRSDRWIPALLVMALLAMPSAASWAETRIGVAASTKPNADGVVARKFAVTVGWQRGLRQ